jgi:hypothetical protein
MVEVEVEVVVVGGWVGRWSLFYSSQRLMIIVVVVVVVVVVVIIGASVRLWCDASLLALFSFNALRFILQIIKSSRCLLRAWNEFPTKRNTRRLSSFCCCFYKSMGNGVAGEIPTIPKPRFSCL